MSYDIVKCEDKCPVCGSSPHIRERCPNGFSWCKMGHAWKQERNLIRERKNDGRMHTVKVEFYNLHYPEMDTQ